MIWCLSKYKALLRLNAFDLVVPILGRTTTVTAIVIVAVYDY